jgi:hypothetical protein
MSLDCPISTKLRSPDDLRLYVYMILDHLDSDRCVDYLLEYHARFKSPIPVNYAFNAEVSSIVPNRRRVC